MNTPDPDRLNEIGTEIVRAAIRVHRNLGPGLLESAYQTCHVFELRRAGLKVESEVTLPIEYRDRRIDCGYRVDVIVDGAVVIENKVVDRILPIHTAQLITYLKLSGSRLGYMLNWKVKLMKRGIHRFVNRL